MTFHGGVLTQDLVRVQTYVTYHFAANKEDTKKNGVSSLRVVWVGTFDQDYEV